MRRIRTRLVLTLVLVALLPAVPLSLLVRGLLARSYGPVLDARLETALSAGLEESRARLAERREAFRAEIASHWLAEIASGRLAVDAGEAGDFPFVFVEPHGTSRPVRALAEIDRRSLQKWAATAAHRAGVPAAGSLLAGPERVGGHLVALVAEPERRLVLIATSLPDGMAARAATMSEGLSLLGLLRQERAAVLRGYVGPFVLVYAALVTLALLVGLWLARRLARPLEALTASARRVAAGDLDARCVARGGGEIGTLVSAFNDMIARLGEQRRELARLERLAAWRGMARTLAHEVKNPLQPILLAVQSAREGYRGDDPQHARLLSDCEEIVREEVEALRRLVRDFSEFARLPEPKLAEGDLRDMLGEVARLYGEQRVVVVDAGGENTAPPHGAERPAAVPARFDAAELRRALINLIDNALAACGEAGVTAPVRLTAGRDEAGAFVTVADDGPGIAPENLARVFAPDFSTKKEGMGLGLAIVDGIARGHGGAVSVRSEPGSGAAFTIRLP